MLNLKLASALLVLIADKSHLDLDLSISLPFLFQLDHQLVHPHFSFDIAWSGLDDGEGIEYQGSFDLLINQPVYCKTRVGVDLE